MAQPGPKTNPWHIAAGVIFILLWALVHLALFYMVAAGGIVADVFLSIIRSILFPGTNSIAQPEPFTWIPALQFGLSLTGLAALPLTLSFFLSRRRKLLLLASIVAFVLGVLAGFYALVVFVSQALGGG